MTPNASRALDVLVASLVLASRARCLPLAALLIKLEGGGPVFYRQRRVGRDGEPFELWKLRTMVPGAEAMGAGIYVVEGDSRITRVGRAASLLARRAAQPRQRAQGRDGDRRSAPDVQEQVDRYTERQRRRLEVRPGITGWAQINGRASLPWPERIELDVWYVEHRSLRLDVRILAKTARLLASGHGLYSDELKQGW